MHPYFHILGYPLPAFGTMLLCAAATAAALLVWRSKTRGLPRSEVFNLMFYALAGVFVGAISLNIIVVLPGVIANWDATVAVLPFWEAVQYLGARLLGIVFYGGFIGGVVAVILYCRRYRTPFWTFADAVAPVIPVAHAVGRIGCFLAGCCYGTEVEAAHPFAVIYPAESLGAPPGVPLLAVPLIESVSNLMIFGLLLALERLPIIGKVPGRLLTCYVALYGMCRFVLEFWRGDDAERGVALLSTSQWIAVALIVGAAFVFLWLPRGRSAREAALTAFLEKQDELARLRTSYKKKRED